jgi:hypothetical protein
MKSPIEAGEPLEELVLPMENKKINVPELPEFSHSNALRDDES